MSQVVLLRDGSVTHDPRLDALPKFDPRGLANYHVRELFETVPAQQGKSWRSGPTLDQGQEGACVGLSWATEIAADPAPYRKSVAELNDLGFRLYNRAQELDEWPGVGYSGTSVLAGAKAAMEMGFFDHFRNGEDVDDLIAALVARSTKEYVCGPAVCGVEWRDGMYDTDRDGVVDVTGSHVGYHSICIRGVLFRVPRISEPVLRWRNTWGTDYGVGGDGLIRASDLATILGSQPEMYFPMMRR